MRRGGLPTTSCEQREGRIGGGGGIHSLFEELSGRATAAFFFSSPSLLFLWSPCSLC